MCCSEQTARGRTNYSARIALDGIFMNAEEFAELDATHERLVVQSTYTGFLQAVQQRASAENARVFATNLTHGDRTKFREMGREQIYKVLTGNHWPTDFELTIPIPG
jgi:hypothetical protein